MRRIGIIGSGQAGLLTAHGLLQAGYEVTLYSDRTAEQWLHQSRPTGTAARMRDALAFERELGLNYWEAEAPAFRGVHLTFCQEVRNPLLTLKGRASAEGLAIDLRLQSHRWLKENENRGGHLINEKVTNERLD
jgi:glycine/D-amino acid oxidase-like deaminating enzyme